LFEVGRYKRLIRALHIRAEALGIGLPNPSDTQRSNSRYKPIDTGKRSSQETPCLACGAPTKFKTRSSITIICEYCRSILARTDHRLEDLGKVADIIETGSLLKIRLRGIYRGVSFELIGRSQIEIIRAGILDQWYATFADGRWGWLAEAKRRFYLT